MSLTVPSLEDQIKAAVPAAIGELLGLRDGPAQLIPKLCSSVDPKDQENVWDSCGQYYFGQGRSYEALSIYSAMYQQFMTLQGLDGVRRHKGTPLVRICDLHAALGHPLIADRFMMLTVCEDAIAFAGRIPAEGTGSYFRAVWRHGISHEEFNGYAASAYGAWRRDESNARFPEWVLQELDQKWLATYPSTTESALYVANRAYVQSLLSQLGGGDGEAMERLAHYLLSCVPGFRARRRVRTHSTDYDVICAVEGPMFDFRSDLGGYFLCECKDWAEPANVTAVLKFSSVLKSSKCHFGIMFSKNGVSGQDNNKDAEREILKLHQQDSTTILVVSESELNDVSSGGNFFSLLRDKYEQIRLDLPKPKQKGR